MAGLSDTSPEAGRVLLEVFRRMPLSRKWRLLGDLYQTAHVFHAAGVRIHHPDATPQEIRQHRMILTLGFAPPVAAKDMAPERPMQNLSGLREVLDVLTKLGICYALGGSMASSVYGVPRYTHDADITVEPFPGKEAQLAGAFGEDYYLSESAICDAVRLRSSFNIINTSSGFKVDVFVRKDRPFEQSAMSRRVSLSMPEAPGQQIVLHTPEDVILFKLWWCRLGNLVSEHQIRDVIGVLQVQAGKLDEAYLDHWAADLGVTDLLGRARQDANG